MSPQTTVENAVPQPDIGVVIRIKLLLIHDLPQHNLEEPHPNLGNPCPDTLCIY